MCYKDSRTQLVDKRTHQHSTDIACQWVDSGYILIGYTRNVPIFVVEKKKAYNRLRFRILFRSRTIVSESTSE